MLDGFIAISPFSGRQQYSAQALRPRPVAANTWSSFLWDLTALPTDSITPASSCPGIFFLGRLIPNPTRKRSRHARGSLRLRNSQSPVVTLAACTLISTSLSLGAGFSTSLSWRTSGGPYFGRTIAFMACPASPFRGPFLCRFLSLTLALGFDEG